MATFKTWYFDQAVFDLSGVLEAAQRDLANVEFDTLVGTGFSGGIVIPSLALAMGKNFVLIRKETDDSHHGRGRLVGSLGERWIFVDDFISSGATRTRVVEKIEQASKREFVITEFIGQYMYSGGRAFEPVGSWAEYTW